jgi:hypothetical protein
MTTDSKVRVAILYPGDREAKNSATNMSNARFLKVFEAFQALGVQAEPAVYHDDFRDVVKQQLSSMHAVLAWVNPIENGRDRSKLDSMLRELAASGIFVSTHPDIILKLGTKEVLVSTKDLGWGSDTHHYTNFEQLRRELPARLSRGEARVIKQYRGHSGDGIWRIERESASGPVTEASMVRARHAKSGCFEEIITLADFFERMQPYFNALNGQGGMIDQVFQTRISAGMVRCYLVQGHVEGFGRQEIVALHPAEAGAAPDSAPSPTRRLYHPPTLPEFQRLKHLVESDWIPAVQEILGIKTTDLPMLWDCDFMFGQADSQGNDTYVLCEINVSCVSPFPDSAAAPLAKAVIEKLGRRL